MSIMFESGKVAQAMVALTLELMQTLQRHGQKKHNQLQLQVPESSGKPQPLPTKIVHYFYLFKCTKHMNRPITELLGFYMHVLFRAKKQNKLQHELRFSKSNKHSLIVVIIDQSRKNTVHFGVCVCGRHTDFTFQCFHNRFPAS